MADHIKTVTNCPDCGARVDVAGGREGTHWYRDHRTDRPHECDDGYRCEGCRKPATRWDGDGVPLCRECWDACPVEEIIPDSDSRA